MNSSKLPDNEFADRGPERQHEQLPPTAAPHRATPASAPQNRAPATETSLGQVPARLPRGVAPTSSPPSQGRDRSAADERAEIAKRIAAFRNLQIKLKQDREDYYERTLARTRAVLASKAKPPQ
jgi:hypothetical protein